MSWILTMVPRQSPRQPQNKENGFHSESEVSDWVKSAGRDMAVTMSRPIFVRPAARAANKESSESGRRKERYRKTAGASSKTDVWSEETSKIPQEDVKMIKLRLQSLQNP